MQFLGARGITVDAHLGTGWQLSVDQGPEWLFFHLSRHGEEYSPEPPVAAVVWQVAEERGPKRLVFELDDAVRLTSHLAGQLLLLHKRAELTQGVFRLCGISPVSYETLQMMGLSTRLPNYRTREDAVMGRLP